MKYAMTWTSRLGAAGKDNEEALRRALELFSKWQPPAGTTFHQFVGRVDGEGGFAIVETDNGTELLAETMKFSPFNSFQIHPVVDMDQWAQAAQQGIDYRNSIG
ncbi:DUF3303 domain-containing protein [Mycolicibacterium vaccae]|jgi:hypothetical protein|nr:DUF3303 family protein [Mycolicibacterium vaccae]MCV7060582.1 DUF3303 family protein [Mycolicibacterium vaccae]